MRKYGRLHLHDFYLDYRSDVNHLRQVRRNVPIDFVARLLFLEQHDTRIVYSREIFLARAPLRKMYSFFLLSTQYYLSLTFNAKYAHY